MNRKQYMFILVVCFCVGLNAKNFEELKREYTNQYNALIASYFYPPQKKDTPTRSWWESFTLFKPSEQAASQKKTQSTRTASKWADICSRSRNAVVQFFTFTTSYNFIDPYKTPEDNAYRGSGFIISDDGFMLTNFHVINEGVKIVVQLPSLGKKKFEVEFVGGSPELDVALMKFTPTALTEIKQALNKETLEYLALGNSDDLSDATEVMSLGFPLGQENFKSSIGFVSGRERTFVGKSYTENEYIQTTTPSTHGNSGGPYLNKYGQVIGIVVGGSFEASGVNWFIPINNIIAALKDFKDRAIIRKPWWGLYAERTTPTMLSYLKSPLDSGILVTEIEKGSLLDQAGLSKGDIITEVFGKKIDNDGFVEVPWTKDKIHLLDILTKIPTGQGVALNYYRNGICENKYIVVENRAKRAIDYVFPWYEPAPDYEIIGGMVVVPISCNLLDITKQYQMPAHETSFFSRYNTVTYQGEPRICVIGIFPQSLAHLTRSFNYPHGDRILSKVNGKEVGTIQDFREAVLLSKNQQYLSLETEGGRLVVLPVKELIEQEPNLSNAYQYKISSLIEQLKN